MPETIEEIRTTFQTTRDAIAQLDGELAAERKAIKVAAFRAGRPLTADEVARRKQIAATRLELAEALQELSLNTLDALDSAPEVAALVNEINAINQQLTDDLNHLKQIEKFAETAAKVAEMLAEAAKVVASLRPTPV
ncbi:MAG: hypothetical protein AAF495_03050 [Pseudomonadota bacterium]